MTEPALKCRRPLSEREKARRRLARTPDYVTKAELIRREQRAQQQHAALGELSRLFWRLPTTHADHEA